MAERSLGLPTFPAFYAGMRIEESTILDEIKIQFPSGATLTVLADTDYVTPELEIQWSLIDAKGDLTTEDHVDRFLTTAEKVIVKWDMQDNEGNPIEPTYENLKTKFKSSVIVFIMNAIGEFKRPNPTTSEPSAAGSSTPNA